MKTVVIIQARVGSSRLPGKALLDLAGQTVLGHTVMRALRIEGVDEVVVATTVEERDDAVVREAERLGVPCFRGSEHDVLSRYLGAARRHDADLIVRITSDCPLIDPVESAKVVRALVRGQEDPRPADYASNGLRRTYPRGLDTEAVTRDALERIDALATAPREREHVTLYINEHADDFRRISVENDEDHGEHRWTVDTPEDFQLVSEIWRRLAAEGPIIPTRSILALFAREPALKQINAHIEQKIP